MSLFAAYSDDKPQLPKDVPNSDQEVTDLGHANESWLKNPSFTVEIPHIPADNVINDDTPPTHTLLLKSNNTVDDIQVPSHSSQSSSHDCPNKKKLKKHKKKSRKQDHKSDSNKHVKVFIHDDEHFYEDTFCAKGNLTVKTLSRPAVPLYRACHVTLGGWPYRAYKKKRIKRYYSHLLDAPEEPKPEVSSTEGVSDNSLENELTSKTAEFNKQLAETPNNVEMWIKYSRFQDMVWQFECTFRRGGGAKGQRVTAERKLAILQEALSHNPGSDVLLREHIGVAEAVLSADGLARTLEEALKRQPGSVSLWRAFARSVQCSLSLCRVPAVVERYEQGMAKLKLLWKGQCLHTWEEGILDLLLDCGLFLRQAGLWEELWALLKLYLEYSTDANQLKDDLFKNFNSVPEEYITELEEIVLSSQLPLSELWYRVERLREGVHWLPWLSTEDCEDPQRTVFPEDVSDLMYPIASPPLTLRLMLIAFTLLKVPLLPFRDTAVRVVGLHKVPWGLDAPEMFLAALYPVGTVDLGSASLLKDAVELVSGPQYLLNQWPGQEQYLDFVVKIFTSCGSCLPEPARTSMCIWWLRFERLLLILEKHEYCKVPQNRKKRLKSTIKDFLKQEKNRNNCLFYLEYALLEREKGQKETACKILYSTIMAQHNQHGGIPVVSLACEQQRAGLCFVYRTLCELLIESPSEAVSVLVALALGESPAEGRATPVPDQVTAAAARFQHVSAELLRDGSGAAPADGSMHLLPHLLVEWTTCHAWLLAHTQSVWAAGAALEAVLAQIPVGSTLSRATCQREALFESYVSILHHFCSTNTATYSVLKEVLHRALKEFPNNLYFMTTVANIETSMTCVGSSWWKLTQVFVKGDCVLPQVFQVFVIKQRLTQHEEVSKESYTSLNIGGPMLPDPSGQNRLVALLHRLLHQPATRRCPLLWRLQLQRLYRQGKGETENTHQTAFYQAVEECPWVKALYLDAVRLLPADLPHLQDLLIEKELRLHVTPEELDILRNSPIK